MSGPILMGLFGTNGTGKSYEAVKYHLLPALIHGQQVATNVAGVEDNIDKIAAYVCRKSKNHTPDEVKALITILPKRKDQLFRSDVWPHPDDWSRDTLIKPGSLVILDECSTVFDAAPPPYVMLYLTEQRHGVDAAGNQGRAILISQDWGHIHRSVRGFIAVTYIFSKYQMLAPLMRILRPLRIGKDYRIQVYTVPGQSPNRQKPDSATGRRYDVEVFDLYRSQDGKLGKSAKIDSRTTIFGSGYMTIVLPAMLLLGCYAAYSLFTAVGGAFQKSEMTGGSATGTPAAASALTPSAPPGSARPLGDKTSPESDAPPEITFAGLTGRLSTEYRFAGTFQYLSETIYVLADSAGRYHYALLSDFKSFHRAGPLVALKLNNGDLVTYTSGAGSAPAQRQGGSHNAPQSQPSSMHGASSTLH